MRNWLCLVSGYGENCFSAGVFYWDSLRSKRFRTFNALFAFLAAEKLGRAQKSAWRGRGKERRKRLPANPTILKNPFVHERSFLIGAAW